MKLYKVMQLKHVIMLMMMITFIIPSAHAKMLWTLPLLTKEFTTIEEIKAHKPPTMPMIVAVQALDFVLSKPEVVSAVHSTMQKGYKQWKVRVFQSSPEQGWKVKIKSSTFIPSYQCDYVFDREGKMLPRVMQTNGCGFNK